MEGTKLRQHNELLYDWNVRGPAVSPPMRKVRYFDETLRDGVQCPSVTDPPIEAKMEMVRLLSGLGVHHVDIGLPGAGRRAIEDSTVLAEMIRDEGLPILAACAARTIAADIEPQHAAPPVHRRDRGGRGRPLRV